MTGAGATPGLGRWHLLATILFVAVVAVWAVLFLTAARDGAVGPGHSGMVTAVFGPGTTIRDVFLALEQAGGAIVAESWLPNIWVVHSGEPGFVDRLQAAGAWLVLDTSPFESLTVPTCGGV